MLVLAFKVKAPSVEYVFPCKVPDFLVDIFAEDLNPVKAPISKDIEGEIG